MAEIPLVLPAAFVARMQQLLGSEYTAFEAALHTGSPTCIRYNPFKTAVAPGGISVPWCPDAVYLSERPAFAQDPLWHAGNYYVQEAGSMFAGHVVQQLIAGMDRPVVLDLCAAPGGKSTHLATVLQGKGLLVANEIIKSRLHILEENLVKWGLPNVVISHNDPSHFSRLENVFDILVVDAPCSGEGLFRRQPEAVQEWSESQVTFCAARQRRILEDVWPSLRPGGYLVYSTCTYNNEENDDNIRWLTSEQETNPVTLSLEEGSGITVQQFSTHTSYRFYPHTTHSEGFFLTILQKSQEDYQKPYLRVRHPYFSWPVREETARLQVWCPQKGYILKKQPNQIINALPEDFYDEIELLAHKLKVVYTGVQLAEQKGKDLNPLQSYANSILLNKTLFPEAVLDLDNALRYLSRNDFSVSSPVGYNLATFNGVPLGWMKQLSNRINNYYPAEWKLRTYLQK